MTVATVHRDVLAALRQHLRLTPNCPADTQIGWEGRIFDAPGGQFPGSAIANPQMLWLAESYAPGPLEDAGYGDGSILLRMVGVYLVDVFAPSGDGTREAWTMAGALLAQFSPTANISYNGQRVVMRRAYASRGRVRHAWYHVPVTLEWRADVLSPAT